MLHLRPRTAAGLPRILRGLKARGCQAASSPEPFSCRSPPLKNSRSRSAAGHWGTWTMAEKHVLRTIHDVLWHEAKPHAILIQDA
jgi:hypothetical protein